MGGMLYAIAGRTPELGLRCYVAPSADLIGSVRLGDEASIWFGAVIRGDNDWIVIGAGSNVQDGTVIHTDAGFPTHLGANVTVGHQALLHSCTVGDETLIGNGASVLDRARIGARCVIGAGALITPDTAIPDGSVVMGAPGKIVRAAGERELQMIRRAAATYRARALAYAELRLLAPGAK
jgi:carbonic anhydrase/acetyltransferase-like protein (isoleucine patch superfamily)